VIKQVSAAGGRPLAFLPFTSVQSDVKYTRPCSRRGLSSDISVSASPQSGSYFWEPLIEGANTLHTEKSLPLLLQLSCISPLQVLLMPCK
jgi:hypothetical protein